MNEFSSLIEKFRIEAKEKLGCRLMLYDDRLYLDQGLKNHHQHQQQEQKQDSESTNSTKTNSATNSTTITMIYGPLELKRYHLMKRLAHAIVFYSIEHNVVAEKLSDCSIEFQNQFRQRNNNNNNNNKNNDDNEIGSLFDVPVPQLMHESVIEYLTALHSLVAQIKRDVFNGRWPDTMLVLVCGGASPRFGHPAMQYFARLCNCTLEVRSIDMSNETEVGCFSSSDTAESIIASYSFVPIDPHKSPGKIS